MPGHVTSVLKIAALASALSLSACDRATDEAELAKLDNAIVGNDVDPALTSALEDQIMVDPALAQQSNRNAAARPGAPVQAQYPAVREAGTVRGRTAAATLREDTGMAGATPCGGEFEYGAAWANRLPAGFGVYPGGRITEAAGSDRGDCRVRVVTYTTDAPPQRVLDWVQGNAARAGYSAERQRRDADHVLAGLNGDAAYYLIVSPKAAGSDVALIANNGR